MSIDSPAAFLALSLDLAFLAVMAGVAFSFVRMAIGPTLADRVIALDMMTVLIVAFCGLYALQADTGAFLDVALVLAVIGFLATVAFARFAERRMAQQDQQAGLGDGRSASDPDAGHQEGTPT